MKNNMPNILVGPGLLNDCCFVSAKRYRYKLRKTSSAEQITLVELLKDIGYNVVSEDEDIDHSLFKNNNIERLPLSFFRINQMSGLINTAANTEAGIVLISPEECDCQSVIVSRDDDGKIISINVSCPRASENCYCYELDDPDSHMAGINYCTSHNKYMPEGAFGKIFRQLMKLLAGNIPDYQDSIPIFNLSSALDIARFVKHYKPTRKIILLDEQLKEQEEINKRLYKRISRLESIQDQDDDSIRKQINDYENMVPLLHERIGQLQQLYDGVMTKVMQLECGLKRTEQRELVELEMLRLINKTKG